MPQPDVEPDDIMEVQQQVKRLYQKYGQDAKLIWTLSYMLEVPVESIETDWDRSRGIFNDALNSDGVFRG